MSLDRRTMKKLCLLLTTGLVLAAVHSWSATKAGWWSAVSDKSLYIYFIDVEGGAATLIVTPAGESVLIDCGWKRPDDRDAKRIHHVATEVAKLSQIDHSVTTHWHRDHFGGIARLSEMMPIKRYYHHGIPERLAEDPHHFPNLIAAYKKVSKGLSTPLRPGDNLPLAANQVRGLPPIRIRCVASDGNVPADKGTSMDNPLCKEDRPKPEDRSDNGRSVALLLSYGSFRFFDGGDLSWNFEKNLVCPTNKVGPVDVYQVNQHGVASSNNPTLVRSLDPRVAIINNGPKKGGDASVYALLRGLPRIEAVYALHRNLLTTAKDNPPSDFIANMDESCRGEFIKVSVDPTGKHYIVGIGAKGPVRDYTTR
ncbi:MAG: MBL fold metallo-hydrolase [Acidobacteria bacterium]|nr:MBL fold metallo-hydrolase [Acidobacteriota bacterium]MBI3657545.1 MBL fold metallo-hydrolase [Acidobacteriota bacterium]